VHVSSCDVPTLTPHSKRQDPLIGNILKWPLAIFKADYTKVKRTNGMDAYFFLRFLRMAIRIFLPIWFFSWAILLPITSVHTSVDNATGLDRFVFGNVSNDKQSRYAAHVILAWAFTGEWRRYVHEAVPELSFFIRMDML
jgi:hypothetical protein